MAQGFVRGDMREKCFGIIIPYYPYLKLLIHLGCPLFRRIRIWSQPVTTLRLADSQHGLDGVAVLGIGDGLVDLAEVIELHEAVKGKLPCLVQLDQFRDKALRHGVALDYAEGFPPFWQRVCAALAGKERHSAMRIQHINGELVHLRVASGFHHVINATTGDIGDAGGDFIMTIVDCVGGAQLQGEFEPHGLMSTPMIGLAPTMRAAMTAARPTAPVPKMAMLAPSETFNEFITVPAPVCRPQPSGARTSRRKSLGTLTRLRSVARAWVANED